MSVERTNGTMSMGQRKIGCALSRIVGVHPINIFKICRKISGGQTISNFESMDHGKVEYVTSYIWKVVVGKLYKKLIQLLDYWV